MSHDSTDLHTRTPGAARAERRRFPGRSSFDGTLHPVPTFLVGGMPHVEADRATDDHGDRQGGPPRQPRAGTTNAARSLFTPEQDAWYEEAVRRGDFLPDDWAAGDGRRRRDDGTTTSAVRYTTASQPPVRLAAHIPARRTTQAQDAPPLPEEEENAGPARPPKRSPLPWKRALVIGVLAMSALTVSANAASSWWQGVQADWSYGYPRLYQTDAVVGHDHDSAAHPSHFLVLNLHGQVDIIELPAGNPGDARIYTGPTLTGPDADQEVATVSFQDVNHDGLPDLVLHVGTTAFVLLNNRDGKFHQPSQQGQ